MRSDEFGKSERAMLLAYYIDDMCTKKHVDKHLNARTHKIGGPKFEIRAWSDSQMLKRQNMLYEKSLSIDCLFR